MLSDITGSSHLGTRECSLPEVGVKFASKVFSGVHPNIANILKVVDGPSRRSCIKELTGKIIIQYGNWRLSSSSSWKNVLII